MSVLRLTKLPVNPKNKQIIIESAKKFGYPLQKNSAAQYRLDDSLVALIVGFHRGEFYASYFDGFMRAGRERKLEVSMFNAPPPTSMKFAV